MYRNRSPQKIQIPSYAPDLLNASGFGSASPVRKRKQTFVTQLSKKQSSQQLVMQSHAQLVKYMLTMEDKVIKIIQSHDFQFLLAYKNHLNRVRKEMEELKDRSSNDTNSASNQTQKIQILQKQITMFREQALNLFEKMTQKDKNIQLLNIKIDQLQTQKKFNKRTISDLMKRNKYLEGLAKQLSPNRNPQKYFAFQETQRKKSLSSVEVNKFKKQTFQQRRVSTRLGWASNIGNSFFYSENQINNHGFEKQSRPTTTAVGSKINSLSTSKTTKVKSVKDYFSRNVPSNLQKE